MFSDVMYVPWYNNCRTYVEIYFSNLGKSPEGAEDIFGVTVLYLLP